MYIVLLKLMPSFYSLEKNIHFHLKNLGNQKQLNNNPIMVKKLCATNNRFVSNPKNYNNSHKNTDFHVDEKQKSIKTWELQTINRNLIKIFKYFFHSIPKIFLFIFNFDFSFLTDFFKTLYLTFYRSHQSHNLNVFFSFSFFIKQFFLNLIQDNH